MYTVSLKVKQHTPIIHFQADQPGATLRATELKPRIDQFVVNDLERVDPRLFEAYKALIHKNNFPFEIAVPAPYKLRIKSVKQVEKLKVTSRVNKYSKIVPVENQIESGYFGNENEDKINAIYSSPFIEIEIRSYQKQMPAFIKEVLAYVLVFHNFGTRQTKGFGCFTPQSMTEEEFFNTLRLANQKKKDKLLKVYEKFKDFSSYKEALKEIKEDYQKLKRGKTHGKYQKSSLFNYMAKHGEGVGWEKRKIKEFIAEKDNKETFNGEILLRATEFEKPYHQPGKEFSDYKFIRALLGLAEQYEFMIWEKDDQEPDGLGYKKDWRTGEYKLKNGKRQPKPDKKKFKVKIEHLPSKETEKIDRFKSPITFKVFEQAPGKVRFYLCAFEMDKAIFNQKFEFKVELPQDDQLNIVKELEEPIKTPDVSDFDLVKFLDYALLNNKL